MQIAVGPDLCKGLCWLLVLLEGDASQEGCIRQAPAVGHICKLSSPGNSDGSW